MKKKTNIVKIDSARVLFSSFYLSISVARWICTCMRVCLYVETDLLHKIHWIGWWSRCFGFTPKMLFIYIWQMTIFFFFFDSLYNNRQRWVCHVCVCAFDLTTTEFDSPNHLKCGFCIWHVATVSFRTQPNENGVAQCRQINSAVCMFTDFVHTDNRWWRQLDERRIITPMLEAVWIS